VQLMQGATLAALAAAAPACAAPARAAPAAFHPPEAQVLLTRELRKALPDGEQIVSRRRYYIRFVPQGAGYGVEGDLVGAEVEAPPELARLAEVERTRSDEGLFPLMLDNAGMIVAQSGDNDPAAEARTMAEAKAYLAQQTELSEADRAAALAMVAKLQAQARASGGNWPADLFRPADGERRESRELPLPDGSAGKVTVTINASDTPDGLLANFQRQIVTELEGTSRLSTETWTLAAIP
jgi:hypothetical protein